MPCPFKFSVFSSVGIRFQAVNEPTTYAVPAIHECILLMIPATFTETIYSEITALNPLIR